MRSWGGRTRRKSGEEVWRVREEVAWGECVENAFAQVSEMTSQVVRMWQINVLSRVSRTRRRC